jgi:hypothetical protein
MLGRQKTIDYDTILLLVAGSGERGILLMLAAQGCRHRKIHFDQLSMSHR